LELGVEAVCLLRTQEHLDGLTLMTADHHDAGFGLEGSKHTLPVDTDTLWDEGRGFLLSHLLLPTGLLLR